MIKKGQIHNSKTYFMIMNYCFLQDKTHFL